MIGALELGGYLGTAFFSALGIFNQLKLKSVRKELATHVNHTPEKVEIMRRNQMRQIEFLQLLSPYLPGDAQAQRIRDAMLKLMLSELEDLPAATGPQRDLLSHGRAYGRR